MSSAHKRVQLRRCQGCNKPGHNRARCTAPLSAVVSTLQKTITKSPRVQKTEPTVVVANKTIPTTPPAPQTSRHLKMFVHHVDSRPEHSPHVVNLRSKNDISWKKTTAASPEKNDSLYHTYHQTIVEEATTLPPITTLPISLLPVSKEPGALRSWFKKITTKPTQSDEAVFSVELQKTSPRPTTITPNQNFQLEKTPSLTDRWQNLTQMLPGAKRLVAAGTLLAILVSVPGPAYGYYQDILSTKASVIKDSSEAFLALQDSTIALKQADFSRAEIATAQALGKFNTALSALNDHRFIETLTSIIPTVGGSLESRQKILLAGQEITVGNSYLLQGLKKDATTGGFSSHLQTVIENLHLAIPNYEKAAQNLAEVDPKTLPIEYQAQFGDFRRLMGSVLSDFKTIDSVGSSFLDIFGTKGTRRYIIVFQNPAELRPTGGFMGSFAVLTVKDGAITKMTVPPGGTYDLQGQLRKVVEPPTPLLLSNKRWEFQDANWFPSFPVSAEKIMWFYRNSLGESVDGVIAINASVLERLLSIMGPVTDEKRAVTLHSDTALATIQKIVEEGPEKQINKPKQIIADLAPGLVKQISTANTAQIIPLLTELQEALEQKEIQAYFTDGEVQNTIKNLGWSGELVATNKNQDYVMVVNTNIQGEKSDANISQTVSHQSVVAQDGTITNTVTITRRHNGTKGEKLYGTTNINYLRLYVPEGSSLLSASGFMWPDEKAFRAPLKWAEKDTLLTAVEDEQSIDSETGTRVTNELGKTAFGNWVITEPGSESTVSFTYRLPFKIRPIIEQKTAWEKVVAPLTNPIARYQLIAQRQSGSLSTFDSQVIFTSDWHPYWQEGENMTLATNGARIAPTNLTKDTVWSLVMQR